MRKNEGKNIKSVDASIGIGKHWQVAGVRVCAMCAARETEIYLLSERVRVVPTYGRIQLKIIHECVGTLILIMISWLERDNVNELGSSGFGHSQTRSQMVMLPLRWRRKSSN